MSRKENNLRPRLTFVIFFLSTLSLFANSPEESARWENFSLLDTETQSRLTQFEQFFDGCFQLPQEYTNASPSEKINLEKQWIKDLNKNDHKTDTDAAAYLGMIRSQPAAQFLEKILSNPPRDGRFRWVCTRSLGQIANKSSIPVLVPLLDNQNANTRVYARVALVEITGVDLGDGKENWENRQNGKPSQLCNSTECKIEKTGSETPENQRSFSKDKLDFCLPDTYGRIVDSQDYTDVPVLIMSGSCWCGGCQQDAEPLGKIAAEYADRDLAVIRTVAGDNELTALDFQKHYRLPFVQLLDTNRSFEKRYNSDGWTFLMLADRQGKIVYKINSPHDQDWNELRSTLNKILTPALPNKTFSRDGIAYMPDTLKRSDEMEKPRICERFPSVTCGPNGQIYVVFTTNKSGSDDVFMRVFDGSNWSDDIPIAATAADEYDGTVLVDRQGHVWICWTSNTSGRYDSFVISFENASKLGTPVCLTHSDDDAMHPRMACDEKGRIWVTYYKWRKMGRYSRDKEVYLQKYENGNWSGEVQVSPTDVSEYEDHADPAIAAYGSGVIVTWSWDFHPPNKGYSAQAEAPTIFIRAITGNMNLGNTFCVSGDNVDVTPVLAVSNNRQIWCAWDSLGSNQRKILCVNTASINHDTPVSKILSLSNSVANVCTPSFAASTASQLALTWSENKSNTVWVLKQAIYDKQSNKWSAPQVVEAKNNPRYCAAAYDSAENLWLAYSVETNEGRKITVTNIGKTSVRPVVSDSNTISLNSVNIINPVQKLHRLIDENYSYRDLRGVDWDKLFELYTNRLERAKTPQEFAESAAKMMLAARDAHLWVKINDETINGFKRDIQRNYNIDLLKKEIPGLRDISQSVSTAQFPDGIGYILIKSWERDENQVLLIST